MSKEIIQHSIQANKNTDTAPFQSGSAQPHQEGASTVGGGGVDTVDPGWVSEWGGWKSSYLGWKPQAAQTWWGKEGSQQEVLKPEWIERGAHRGTARYGDGGRE